MDNISRNVVQKKPQILRILVLPVVTTIYNIIHSHRYRRLYKSNLLSETAHRILFCLPTNNNAYVCHLVNDFYKCWEYWRANHTGTMIQKKIISGDYDQSKLWWMSLLHPNTYFPSCVEAFHPPKKVFSVENDRRHGFIVVSQHTEISRKIPVTRHKAIL